MNFEEAYKKVQDGTATDEEAAFVGREIVNAQKVTTLLLSIRTLILTKTMLPTQ